MKLWKILAVWITTGVVLNQFEKWRVEEKAIELSKISGKPIISIGAKCNLFGDVKCDIKPKCGAIYCDAENLSQFKDKEFSVALLSHVIEHIEYPDRAVSEAKRIAENVLIIVPSPIWLQTWTCLDHKWVFFGDRRVRLRQ